ncbi:MAG TPA: BREX-2 system phosphatase PglZ, partial [Pirellulales bacterium]
MLVESVPSDGYPAAPAGFLDAETVWDVLLSRRLGLAGHDVDLASLLRWSIEPGAIERFRDADPVFRQAAVEWLTQRAGPATAIVLGGLPSWRKLDALALGLAASVVHHPAAIGRLEKAAGKIEGRYFSGQTPAVEVMQRWAFAAVEVVRRIRHTDQRLYREALHRGDDLLREAGADEFAYLSDTSPSGFDQRLALFGRRLKEVVAQGDWSRREDLLAERESIRRHDFAHAAAPRIERLDMALRLVGWMESASEAEPTNRRSLGAAGAEHLHEDSFADWARTALHAGDEVRELSESYTQLSAAAAARRERQAKTFAELLVDWSVVDSSPTDFVPVEKLLDEIVAPLAAERPVLLMVIDGMSAAVAHELTADLTKRGWIALAEPGRLQNRPGIAMIPSKTEYSRASLLCGARRRGAAAEEQAGFTQHAGLLAACHPGVPPILFHKVALQGDQDAGLSKEVRDAVQAANRRIVGVVLNAVDDNLKGGRLELQWSHDRMHVLPALLYEAES